MDENWCKITSPGDAAPTILVSILLAYLLFPHPSTPWTPFNFFSVLLFFFFFSFVSSFSRTERRGIINLTSWIKLSLCNYLYKGLESPRWKISCTQNQMKSRVYRGTGRERRGNLIRASINQNCTMPAAHFPDNTEKWIRYLRWKGITHDSVNNSYSYAGKLTSFERMTDHESFYLYS